MAALAGGLRQHYVPGGTEPSAPQDIPPFIDWMSRHGIKVLAALILIELGFHAWAVMQSKRHEADRRPEPRSAQRPLSSVARVSHPAS